MKFDKAGTYRLQLANRSAGHAYDRMALYRVNTYGNDYQGNLNNLNNVPQSDRVGSNAVAKRVAQTTVNNVSESLTIYPNPAVRDGQITITNANQGDSKVNVTIYDRLGKVIYRSEEALKAGQHAEVDLAKLNLQKGTYTISWNDGVQDIKKTIILR